MLSREPEKLTYWKKRKNILKKIPSELRKFLHSDDEVTNINYPVNIFPVKVKSLSLSKLKKIEGKLTGLRGSTFCLKMIVFLMYDLTKDIM